MATQQIANCKENAEICHGESLCNQKILDLLDQISLPRGLLPLEDIVEVGYNRSSGFVWIKQKKRKEHRFQAIGRRVSYESEFTAFLENRRMRRITGVKSKELLFWVTISEIYIGDPNSGKISFATPAGISRSFPVSAFQLQSGDDEKKMKT